jgi:hypothetical protein
MAVRSSVIQSKRPLRREEPALSEAEGIYASRAVLFAPQ